MAKFDKNSDGRIEMSEVRTNNLIKGHISPLFVIVCLLRTYLIECVYFSFQLIKAVIHKLPISFQLAQILPTEENFLLCFREFVGSSAEFMNVSFHISPSVSLNVIVDVQQVPLYKSLHQICSGKPSRTSKALRFNDCTEEAVFIPPLCWSFIFFEARLLIHKILLSCEISSPVPQASVPSQLVSDDNACSDAPKFLSFHFVIL